MLIIDWSSVVFSSYLVLWTTSTLDPRLPPARVRTMSVRDPITVAEDSPPGAGGHAEQRRLGSRPGTDEPGVPEAIAGALGRGPRRSRRVRGPVADIDP